mmetsp:Transcript_42379/g.70749  ORF Transcript_42379/g.70749 Transcript_42379/m.70749 type:complete len:278 (-) Transcript_42379:694-1527(-)
MGHDEIRMYEQRYPEVDDVVMVTVKSIAEMGAYVALLEYNGIEGMILLSELSRRRIRSISKLIKVGRQEPVMVLRVDKEKGYIDLSKRRVSPEDIARCEEKYNKSKMVHSIMRHVAETTPAKLADLYLEFGWPCYKTHGHAFEGFKTLVSDPEAFFPKLHDQGAGRGRRSAQGRRGGRRFRTRPAARRGPRSAHQEHPASHDPTAAQDSRGHRAHLLPVRRSAAHQGGDACGRERQQGGVPRKGDAGGLPSVRAHDADVGEGSRDHDVGEVYRADAS